MEVNQQPPSLEDWEKGKPLPRWFGRELPWWFALMVYGDSAPIDETELQKTKHGWIQISNEKHPGIVKDARERFHELDASTMNNFVRLTIVAGVIAGLMGMTQWVAPLIMNSKTPALSLVAAWLYMLFMLVTVVSALMMVAPKFKEFRRFKPEARNMGLDLLHNCNEDGWPEFVRLLHRYAHRIQLITFERRVKHVGCWSGVLSTAATCFALLLA